ncbi:hypothetical protein D0B54_01895 [Solimonas sp. K1W22B-7]|uniref:winged helix-turn-helix domain-containing protein n=1 Tax=Solimonas sp. K1W22B-7 TaxID=2303331 RepID=UPI000E334D9C|nr:winged helix-turn-helix domain-containing protein [Solimonas sp. K1W22B-7]AXQ27508.1 hypothetical protein D0B54_01895 [Solimonas sp. K1W22B-7]
MPVKPSCLEFGRFKILRHRREFLADGCPVDLGSRNFDLLLSLVEARGETVSKNELLSKVWLGRIVEENSLQAGISSLRKVLGADRDLIRTVAGYGYQFVGDVSESRMQGAAGAQTANLPAAVSTLISREGALSDIEEIFRNHRLVTLTGAGGIGKTQLALHAARAMAPMFSDGVRFADLAPLADPNLLPSSVAMALGLPPSALSVDRVVASIGHKNYLFVLDNCEHMVSSAAAMVEQLMRAAPQLRVLCTSREPLRLDGEQIYQVQPLDVPTDGIENLEEVLSTGSAKLFVSRLHSAQAAFTPDQRHAKTIGVLCRRLDGLPLAIEFAAARAATIGIDELTRRLDNRFRLLAGGHRTALPRHQTLRAALDWSYELLTESDRQSLSSLAVFAGSFTLEAASAVLASSDADSTDALDSIASLSQKSLISIQAGDENAPYRLLETTRAYALEKLGERNDAQQVARRHATYHMAVARRSAEEWEVEPLAEWITRYARLVDDVRLALDWAFAPEGEAGIGIEIVIAMGPLWRQFTLVDEWRTRIDQALRAAQSCAQSDSRVAMQLGIAEAQVQMGTFLSVVELEARYRHLLQIAEGLGDCRYQMFALISLVGNRLGDLDCSAALKYTERYCCLASSQVDPVWASAGDVLMAMILSLMGEQRRAKLYLDRCPRQKTVRMQRIPFFRSDRDSYLNTHARVLWLQGFADQAIQTASGRLDEASDSTADVLKLCYRYQYAAYPVAMLSGDLRMAEETAMSLLNLATKYALPLQVAWARCFAAALEVRRGAYPALQRLRTGIEELVAAKQPMGCEHLTIELAAGLWKCGKDAEALEVIDSALAEAERTGARWCKPEQLRIRGEILLARGGQLALAEAENCFRLSLDLAAQQEALSWELRTAVSLARLRQLQGDSKGGATCLQGIYHRFTEGFSTTDLVAAKALLDILQAPAVVEA